MTDSALSACRPPDQLRADALAIWQAGVEAVRSDRLVRATMRVEGRRLVLGDEELDLDALDKIVVVGTGKAGAGMAAAVEEVLGPRLLQEKQVTGWVNVPEDCVRPLQRVHLHAARPAGVNEPMEAGVAGALEILRLVESLGPRDLCLCLISGGGSALLPAPVEGITLEDKLAVTRHLSAAGANIEELNAVRKQLSRIKGGGLARACRAGRLAALVISDVLGDPLDVIASGPTAEDTSTPQAALAVLERFNARSAGISPRVFQYLEDRQSDPRSAQHPFSRSRNESEEFSRSRNESEEFSRSRNESENGDSALSFRERLDEEPPLRCHVTNRVIGNNATAVDAAGQEAVRRGYSPAMLSAPRSEGPAEDVGRHLAEMALAMRDRPGPDCLISGGEPVVRLVEKPRRGLGGRNQQLVLAALERLAMDGAAGVVILSGGTDGEDGPTDAAGAWLDASILAAARQQGLEPGDYLARNDAYHFFAPLGSLIRTGPTHTNVCDLRVVVVGCSDALRLRSIGTR